MSEKIRVACSGCDKTFACPASTAGKKIKCPACGAVIRVPNDKGSGPESTQQQTRRAPSKTGSNRTNREPPYSTNDNDDFGGAEYENAAALPRRSRQRKNSGVWKSEKTKATHETPHWSKNMKVGAGIIVASLCSSAVQIAINGPPNTRTAAGKGQALGQGLVTVIGVMFGIVVLLTAFKARRSEK